MKQCEGDRLVIGVYVDDLIITSSNTWLMGCLSYLTHACAELYV